MDDYTRRKVSIMISSGVHGMSQDIEYENRNTYISLTWICPKCGAKMKHTFDLLDGICNGSVTGKEDS